MSEPDYIRYFASTDGSPLSETAWTFMRRMIRIKPVRVVSFSGGMSGRWIGYEELTMTPMVGTFVNVVCVDSSRWTWLQRVQAPTTQLTAAQIAAGAGGDVETETITARQELWTSGCRNVLIALQSPRSDAELATAKKYDAVIVTSTKDANWWAAHFVTPTEIAHPYADAAVKSAILGTP